MSKVHAALEIGTSRTVLAIGERQSSGRLKFSHEDIPSTGVRKSQILDITQATQSVRSVLHGTTSKRDASGASLTIVSALLVVSGQHIKADPTDATTLIKGRKVGANDIADVVEQVEGRQLPNGRELLEIADQGYGVDGLYGILDPKGMSGRTLKFNALHIHADSHRIQNARTAAENAHLEIIEPVFAATCAAEAVLEEHEKKNGALVLDLGGGSTGYAVYVEGRLADCGVIGVGGDHVTSDIAHAFQTTNAQAEKLKLESATATINQYSTDNARVRVTGSSALMESRTISRRALDTVVNVRIKELFEVLRETLETRGLLHRLNAGIVLTGGGANLRDIESVAERELGAKCRKGRPLNVDGLEDEPSPWSYAAVCGALLYALHNHEDESFFNRLFGRGSK